MNIGVDAGMLGITDERLKVGVWRVVHNVLIHLSELDKKNTYYVYSFHPIPTTYGPNVINRVLRPTFGWMTWRVPLELLLHPVDIFLGFGQSLPATTAKKIGFIYDLGFLDYPQLYPNSKTKLARQTERVIHHADNIITISHAVKQEIQAKFSKESFVMPLGVSDIFTKDVAPYKGEHPYFLYAGSLKPGKNIPKLIEAFENFLQKSNKIFDLYLIGSNYWMDPDIHLNKHIKNIGFVSDSQLPSYYRGATAFISPSLVEGFCLPAAEALACGTPVIVSDIPVMHEIVQDAGIYVDPNNSDDIANAMNNVKKINSVHNYSWDKSAQTLLNVINSL